MTALTAKTLFGCCCVGAHHAVPVIVAKLPVIQAALAKISVASAGLRQEYASLLSEGNILHGFVTLIPVSGIVDFCDLFAKSRVGTPIFWFELPVICKWTAAVQVGHLLKDRTQPALRLLNPSLERLRRPVPILGKGSEHAIQHHILW